MIGIINKHADYLDAIGLVNPNLVSTTIWKSNMREAVKGYQDKIIVQNISKRFTPLPYNENDHWVLIVINMCDMFIYIFDPLPLKPLERKFDIAKYLKQAVLDARNKSAEDKLTDFPLFLS